MTVKGLSSDDDFVDDSKKCSKKIFCMGPRSKKLRDTPKAVPIEASMSYSPVHTSNSLNSSPMAPSPEPLSPILTERKFGSTTYRYYTFFILEKK